MLRNYIVWKKRKTGETRAQHWSVPISVYDVTNGTFLISTASAGSKYIVLTSFCQDIKYHTLT